MLEREFPAEAASRPVPHSVGPIRDPRQRLRLRRFGMALAVYLLSFLVAWLGWLSGFVPGAPLAYAALCAAAFNVALLGAFASGINQRFRDPSLTLVQLVVATAFIMAGAYLTDEARPLFLMLYAIPFLFGAFRLPVRQHAIVALFALACLAVVIAMAGQSRPEAIQWPREWLQWGTLAIVLVWMIALGHSLKTMRHRASHDQLTGLHNRHYVLANLERELSRHDRGGPPVCVALIDIDHFKRVNDELGHGGGDQVLRLLARNIREQLRNIDDFGRYGGDEFVAVLPDTALREALATCERIRHHVAATDPRTLGRETGLSVSIGVAEVELAEPMNQLIERADRALFAAKRAGRNRTVAARVGEEPVPEEVPTLAASGPTRGSGASSG